MSSLATKIRLTVRHLSPAALFDAAMMRLSSPAPAGDLSRLDILDRSTALVTRSLDSIDYGPLDARTHPVPRPFSLPAPRDIWSDDPDRSTRRGDVS